MNEYIAHTEERHGFRIEIVADPHPDIGLKDDDTRPVNLVMRHGRYDFPDDLDHLNNMEVADHVHEIAQKGGTVKRIYLYDHSGLRLMTSTTQTGGWDTSWIGFAWITAKEQAEYQKSIEKMEAEDGVFREITPPEVRIERYIDYMDDIVSGNVWGYRVVEDDEVVDSCWGFVGDPEDDYILGEARAVVDQIARNDGTIPRSEDDRLFNIDVAEYRIASYTTYAASEQEARERVWSGQAVQETDAPEYDREIVGCSEAEPA